MNRKLNVVFAIVAGLLGSAIMHYAFAQDRPAVTREIRAQSLVLVDAANNVVGTFSTEPMGPGVRRGPYRVVLRDTSGRVIWTPETGTKLMPLTSR